MLSLVVGDPPKVSRGKKIDRYIDEWHKHFDWQKKKSRIIQFSTCAWYWCVHLVSCTICFRVKSIERADACCQQTWPWFPQRKTRNVFHFEFLSCSSHSIWTGIKCKHRPQEQFNTFTTFVLHQQLTFVSRLAFALVPQYTILSFQLIRPQSQVILPFRPVL